jgi:hypothetical protein
MPEEKACMTISKATTTVNARAVRAVLFQRTSRLRAL